MKDIRLILHDIRSAYNVGSIFRTADGAGVSKIYLTGYTPEPKDKFGRWRNDISKVALGAEKNIPWGKYTNIEILIEDLKKEGLKVIAVEQDSRSKDFNKFKKSESTVFILGNETEGISKDILKQADEILEIRMKGKKESLNVSVVAGIVLFNTI
jgi:23S rRNA (guanosine2251-2'-O)-methyltransferase